MEEVGRWKCGGGGGRRRREEEVGRSRREGVKGKEEVGRIKLVGNNLYNVKLNNITIVSFY